MEIDVTRYKRIVILTGAGVSAASGIRTYRGKGGIWDEHNVEEYGHVSVLTKRPDRTWKLFGQLRTQVREAQPNKAHYVLAELERDLDPSQRFTLITQNVDGLHLRAGSTSVVELHGNVTRTRCSNDDCDLVPFHDEAIHDRGVLLCPTCLSVLRPDIVLFGEQLPPVQSAQAKLALQDCDLFVAIGTSGIVPPAARYVQMADTAGARTVCVNLEPMEPRNTAFKEEYLGKAEELLPVLFGVEP